MHQHLMRGEHNGFGDIETQDLLTGTGAIGSCLISATGEDE
jgi:hypothetical protein